MRSHTRELVPVFKLHADLCKGLANHHRLAILYVLSVHGETCVGDLAAELGTSQTNVSQHLRMLKERMVVRSRKDAQTVYYSVANPKFIEGCTLIRQALIEQHQAAGQSFASAGLIGLIEAPIRPAGGGSRPTKAGSAPARVARPARRRADGTG
jgi:DNA-binding transcriptional ArsR family regulator